jgi:hypothetical protein
MGKGVSTHWVPELTEVVENFFFKILIVYNDPSDTGKMGNLRKLTIKGIRESVPPSQNIAKAFNV